MGPLLPYIHSPMTADDCETPKKTAINSHGLIASDRYCSRAGGSRFWGPFRLRADCEDHHFNRFSNKARRPRTRHSGDCFRCTSICRSLRPLLADGRQVARGLWQIVRSHPLSALRPQAIARADTTCLRLPARMDAKI